MSETMSQNMSEKMLDRELSCNNICKIKCPRKSYIDETLESKPKNMYKETVRDNVNQTFM